MQEDFFTMSDCIKNSPYNRYKQYKIKLLQ